MRTNPFTQHPSFAYIVVILAIACAGCLPATRTVRHGGADTSSLRTIEHTLRSPGLYGKRLKVISEAESWIGTPYLFGGVTRQGVDCSGFVANVFAVAGATLPRQSHQQAEVGDEISLTNGRPGDLVFFNTTGIGVSHVGILLEYPCFVHASTSRGVIVSRLDEGYYRDRIVCARRVLP